jgi:hypothetical protein
VSNATRWEYTLIQYNPKDSKTYTGKLVHEDLTSLGRDGFELAGTLPYEPRDERWVFLIFKRPAR